MRELFTGLNIPYLSEESYIFGVAMKKRMERLTIDEIKREKEDNEQTFEYEEDKLN